MRTSKPRHFEQARDWTNAPRMIRSDRTPPRLLMTQRGTVQVMMPNGRFRTVAAVLMVIGALLMLLAPAVWVGAIPLTLGMLLEVIGIAIEHRRK